MIDIKELRKGDIVRCESRTLRIDEINNDVIKTIWGEYSIEDILPVEIGSGYDANITLKSHIPIMATYVRDGDPTPIHQDYYFMQYEIDNVKIADVVRNNHIIYVHELQRWLEVNMPDEYLYV
ncbi:hypothetical protein [uncultured Bacteroides sp.]|uniref:hypothetical protein n=1 Tax=uncultured Bacteroides sp. TaxID=162156 RepID=UPI00280B12D2|nr:hypothetical protein [uncultured Bacteroides sp.]